MSSTISLKTISYNRESVTSNKVFKLRLSELGGFASSFEQVDGRSYGLPKPFSRSREIFNKKKDNFLLNLRKTHPLAFLIRSWYFSSLLKHISFLLRHRQLEIDVMSEKQRGLVKWVFGCLNLQAGVFLLEKMCEHFESNCRMLFGGPDAVVLNKDWMMLKVREFTKISAELLGGLRNNEDAGTWHITETPHNWWIQKPEITYMMRTEVYDHFGLQELIEAERVCWDQGADQMMIQWFCPSRFNSTVVNNTRLSKWAPVDSHVGCFVDYIVDLINKTHELIHVTKLVESFKFQLTSSHGLTHELDELLMLQPTRMALGERVEGIKEWLQNN